jgi:hypothetical protein
MAGRYALTEVPYTLDDVSLGSLVPSIDRPHQDTIGPARRLRYLTDYKWRGQSNLNLVQREQSQRSISAKLARFLGFGLAGNIGDAQSNQIQLRSREGRMYELVQPKQLFLKLVARPDTREWLENAWDASEDVHYVVGYLTLFDATEVDAHSAISTIQGGVDRHTEPQIIRGPNQGLSVSRGAAAGISASDTVHSYEQGSSEAPGERIYAICFRKVRFDWFSSRVERTGKLEKDNCWIVTSMRGSDGDSDGESEGLDAIEINFEEDIETVQIADNPSLETNVEVQEIYIP